METVKSKIAVASHHSSANWARNKVHMISCRKVLVLSIAAGVVIFHLSTLTRYPPIFVDEAWMVSRAWAWYHTGFNFGPLDAGVFEKLLDGVGTIFPIIPTMLISGFIHWFGLEVSWLRLLPLLCGLTLLGASFSIAYQFSASKSCGLMAALLVATSHSFLISAHLIRYDIVVAAFAYGSLAICLAGCRRGSSVLLFIAGLMIAAAFEAHVNAAIFAPIFITIFVSQRGWGMLGTRQFGAFASAAFIGLAAYFFMHVARYPTTFFALSKSFAATHLPPILSPGVMQSWDFFYVIGGYWTYLTYGRIVIAALAAGTLYSAGCRNSRTLFLMLVLGLTTFSLLIGNMIAYYAILLAPLSDIFLAVWIHEMSGAKVKHGFWVKRAQALGIATLIVTLSLPAFTVFPAPPAGELKLIGQRVRSFLPSNASIMGSPTYWFELSQYRYIGWIQILIHKFMTSSSSVDSALYDLRPDFLIIDDEMRNFVIADGSPAPQTGLERYLRQRGISKEQLDVFLKRRAELIDHFVSPTYGTIELYSIHWDMAR